MPDPERRSRRAATGVRTAALWAVVRDLAERRAAESGRPMRVLDLGGGTGELAVPLAELGPALVADVTVVDPSPDALAALDRRAAESRVGDRVHGHQGDADTLADVLPALGFDLVCCHGVLDLVDDPLATLRVLRGALADDGHLSLLVAGRLAAVWARALAGELAQAHTALTSDDGRWGASDPLPRRFDLAEVRRLLVGAGLREQSWHGIRLVADLVPSTAVDTDADRAALVALEDALAGHAAYPFLGELAAALHLLARRA